MSLHDELLATARRLVAVTAPPPTDGDLRRVISTAYYALFHRLIDAAVTHLLPAHSADQRAVLARAFEHRTIKSVCGRVIDIARRPGSGPLVERALGVVTPTAPVTPELVRVARTFVALQQQRQDSDYDRNPVHDPITLAGAMKAVAQAATAFTDWSQLETAAPAVAQAFLVLLLTGEPKSR